MMKLTMEQQMKVSENTGLVYRVIHDKLHAPYQAGIYTFDDLFQIGCIGLCKAAATDRGGVFSTYAYRLIWNEICDAIVYFTRRQAMETACDVTPYIAARPEVSEELSDFHMDIDTVLNSVKLEAPSSTAKGIEAMRLMAVGYTSGEIGEKMGASAKLVCAWVSKARKYLKGRPEIAQIASAYHVG